MLYMGWIAHLGITLVRWKGTGLTWSHGNRSSGVLESDRLGKTGIADRDHWPGPAGMGHDRTRGEQKRSQHRAVQPVRLRPLGVELGHDEPVEIEVMEDQDPGCEKAQPERVSSDRPEEEQEERDHEMSETERPAQRVPRPRPAGDVPHGLLGEVRAPDQEVLTEGNVRPEDHETEEQLAQIVQVLDG